MRDNLGFVEVTSSAKIKAIDCASLLAGRHIGLHFHSATARMSVGEAVANGAVRSVEMDLSS